MKTGAKRSPRQARGAKTGISRPVRPIFSLDLGLDNLEMDFDLDDFDIEGESERRPRGERQKDVRILRPMLDRQTVTQHRAFENAEAFARQIDLTPGTRTFAWVNGNFIFGDIIEALITGRSVGIKKIYACSLSIGQDNIDSLKNVMLLMGDMLERMVLVFSGFQYSHRKFDLIPYMYRELDDPAGRVQIAFGRWHAKLITLETIHGHTLTVHGSANLCSSNSIEQIMVEVDDQALHRFNADIMERIAEKFGTINTDANYTKLRAVEGREAWELFTAGIKED